jgi:hypothetical protein
VTRKRRIVLRAVLALAALVVLAGLFAAFLPAGVAPMPETIWIRGAESVMRRDVGPADLRVGGADGPAFEDAVIKSRWGSKDGDGISLRRPLSEGQRRKARMARVGVLPRYRIYYAGYEPTGQTAERDGATWREFRLFNPRFGCSQIGWWPWGP